MKELQPSLIKLLLGFVFSGAVAGVLFCAPSASANESESNSPALKADLRNNPPTVELPDSQGVRLAKQELPELVSVLERLKHRAPTQFEKAVKDLDRAAKRLDTLKRREPELYEAALAEWRMRAQLDLLKAKHKARPSKESEAAIDQQQKAIKNLRTEQIEKELASIAAREKLLNERIQQARLSLERGEQRRQQLQAELAKSPIHTSHSKVHEESKTPSSQSENESRE